MKNSNEIAEITTQLEQVRAQRRELQLLNDAKVKQVFDYVFNIFNKFDIIVQSESASFFFKDDVKQLFTIYFYERYSVGTNLELSFYTTNTQSEFELDRVIALGEVAQLIKSNSQTILTHIADIKKENKDRENELYAVQDSYEKKLAQFRKAEYDNKKVQIELQLKGEGVEFEAPVYFQFKRNYTLRIVAIKVIEVSKSGKTCTVRYTTTGRSVGKEDRVDFESVISQVLSQEKNIV